MSDVRLIQPTTKQVRGVPGGQVAPAEATQAVATLLRYGWRKVRDHVRHSYPLSLDDLVRSISFTASGRGPPTTTRFRPSRLPAARRLSARGSCRSRSTRCWSSCRTGPSFPAPLARSTRGRTPSRNRGSRSSFRRSRSSGIQRTGRCPTGSPLAATSFRCTPQATEGTSAPLACIGSSGRRRATTLVGTLRLGSRLNSARSDRSSMSP